MNSRSWSKVCWGRAVYVEKNRRAHKSVKSTGTERGVRSDIPPTYRRCPPLPHVRLWAGGLAVTQPPTGRFTTHRKTKTEGSGIGTFGRHPPLYLLPSFFAFSPASCPQFLLLGALLGQVVHEGFAEEHDTSRSEDDDEYEIRVEAYDPAVLKHHVLIIREDDIRRCFTSHPHLYTLGRVLLPYAYVTLGRLYFSHPSVAHAICFCRVHASLPFDRSCAHVDGLASTGVSTLIGPRGEEVSTYTKACRTYMSS